MTLSFQNKIRPVEDPQAPVSGVSFASKARPVTAPTSKEDKGSFVGDLARGLVSAPATLLARPIQLAAEAIMPGDNTEAIDRFSREKLGGFVAPVPQGGSDVVKDVGRGVQTVALGTGAPLATGAAFGFGASLENQGSNILSKEGATDALTSTLIGMGAGKALDLLGKPLINAAGKVIGTITPKTLLDVSSKGATAVQKFMAHHEIVPKGAKPVINAIPKAAEAFDSGVNKLFRGTADVATGAVQSQYPNVSKEGVAKHYEKVEVDRLFEPTKKTDAAYRNATAVYKDAQRRNVNLEKIAADNKMYTSDLVDEGKFSTQEAVDALRDETMSEGHKILRPALRAASPGVPRVPISEVRNEILSRIGSVPDAKLSPAQKLSFAKRVAQEYGDDSVAGRLYKDGYSLENLYDSKLQTSSKLYKAPKGGGVQSISDSLTSQQKQIESQALDAILRRTAPKELGLDAYFKAQEGRFILADYLQSLNTKKAPMTMFQKGVKRASQLAGATTGASVAGPFGMFSGYQFGGIVADTFAKAPNPVKVAYLKSIGKTEPEIYNILREFVSDAEAKALSRLKIGGPSAKTSPDLMRMQNPQGAVEMGYTPTGVNKFQNDITQNTRLFGNTKMLPAPAPRMITPNTQGTPNRLSRLYKAGGDEGEVGGMRQRRR